MIPCISTLSARNHSAFKIGWTANGRKLDLLTGRHLLASVKESAKSKTVDVCVGLSCILVFFFLRLQILFIAVTLADTAVHTPLQ